jgi:hypothetical protein
LDEQIATELGQLPHLAGNLLWPKTFLGVVAEEPGGLGRAGDSKVFGPGQFAPGPSG